MKLENEHVLAVQTPPRKSYNPFDSDDEIEATNGYSKSNLNGYDIKSFETNGDSLTFHLDSSELSWEEAILGHSQVLSHKIPVESNSEEVVFRKDTELFTDKTVTECELPELMVCYKDNAYNSVKDIGIDEGMPAHDKVSIKNRDNHGSKNLPAFLGLNGDNNGKLPVGSERQEQSYTDGLKSRMDDDLEKDVSSQNQPQDSVKDDRLDLESVQRQKSADKCGTNNSNKVDDFKLNSSKNESVSSLKSSEDHTGSVVYSTTDPELSKTDELSYREFKAKHDNISAEELSKDAAALENSHKSSTMSSVSHSAVAGSESNESQEEGATLAQPTDLPASEELLDDVVSNALPYNSKVESGSIVLDFKSSNIEEKEENEKSQQNEAVAKAPEAQTMSRHDENSPDNSLNLGMDNRVHGEASFSAAMPPPASITYMGPYAHAGNISLRSESSAGSTRSFAFPVLQAEWNSSPVRMAKSEQRNFRKQRGWIQSLICCKF